MAAGLATAAKATLAVQDAPEEPHDFTLRVCVVPSVNPEYEAETDIELVLPKMVVLLC